MPALSLSQRNLRQMVSVSSGPLAGQPATWRVSRRACRPRSTSKGRSGCCRRPRRSRGDGRDRSKGQRGRPRGGSVVGERDDSDQRRAFRGGRCSSGRDAETGRVDAPQRYAGLGIMFGTNAVGAIARRPRARARRRRFATRGRPVRRPPPGDDAPRNGASKGQVRAGRRARSWGPRSVRGRVEGVSRPREGSFARVSIKPRVKCRARRVLAAGRVVTRIRLTGRAK